jgi:phosphoribosylformylglycinamidine cyclo-ligase
LAGRGFSGNIPRVLPANCDVRIDTDVWPKLPIFRILQEEGGVTPAELYEVFNMGIGMTLFVSPDTVEEVSQHFKKPRSSPTTSAKSPKAPARCTCTERRAAGIG